MTIDTRPTLALDLATCTGWAVRDTAGSVHSGAWQLGGKGGGMCRYLNLWQHLDGVRLAHGVPRVAVERPVVHRQFASGARVAYGLLAVVQLFGSVHGASVTEYTPAAVKKAATGKGNAGKEAVIECMRRIFGGQRIGGHDQADALAVLYAFERDRGLKASPAE